MFGRPDGQSFHPTGRPADPPKLATASLTHWLEHDHDLAGQGSASAIRVRRRAPPSSDHVKHRRTRSGCYTCRSRRVKCDEVHPTCERCQKGSRECVYPESASVTSASKPGQTRSARVESESSSDEYDNEEGQRSPGAVTGKPGGSSPRSSRPSVSSLQSVRQQQNRQALAQAGGASLPGDRAGKEESMSPFTDVSSNVSKDGAISQALMNSGILSTVSTASSTEPLPWSHLSEQLQYHLNYHRENINWQHYFFKHDAAHFVHSTLLETALNYDPLLYAVVGFAAFQLTLKNPHGRISDFLGYYNKSVSLLRKSLQAGQQHTDATILTILQLAAFEEYLGDWVNLLGHQKAAYEMMLKLYTPQTIMQTETRRKILAWYSRFDLFVGLMAGNQTVLGAEWFMAQYSHCEEMLRQDPDNSDRKIERYAAYQGVIAMDMAVLFAKLPRGEITIPDFLRENELISQKIAIWKTGIDELMSNTKHVVMSFTGAPPPDPNDIVDPYVPGFLLNGPLWSVNFMRMDWYAINAMHMYQTAVMLQQPLSPDLEQIAKEQCRLLEAIEYWPGGPAGALLPAQASLGLVCLFLPRDERHTSWCRKKLAKVESMGYIYPTSLRTKLSEYWNMPDLLRWWLPNDDLYPPIVRRIRSFIEERTVKPRNQTSEDIRNMKAMFGKLNVDDSSKDSPGSATGTTISSTDDGSYAYVRSDDADQEGLRMGEMPLPDMELTYDQEDPLEPWAMGNPEEQQGYYH